MTWEIEIKKNLRPCLVRNKRALFHTWYTTAYPVEASMLIGGAPAGQYSRLYGLVEYEDGKVEGALPAELRFIDGGEFSDYDFEMMEQSVKKMAAEEG